MKSTMFTLLPVLISLTAAQAQTSFDFVTEAGTLTVTPLGHASVLLELNDTIIHIDPYSEVADYSQQPEADWIWVTHEHSDHLDLEAIHEIATEDTQYLMDERTAEASGLENVTLIANGDTLEVDGMMVIAVPAYNVVRERENGQKYHPEGWYNGFILEIGDFRMHVGGDTECIPEFADVGNLTVSFLPINLPYTMPPEEAAACYRILGPEIAIPYHQGDSDPQIVADLLADTDIDVKVLDLP
jgi:L-ascorbate metabolism protein UlaG (beta-lactamase superfamily)